MVVAKLDLETIRCILGISSWDFCLKAKRLREEVNTLEVKVERLIEKTS